MSPLETIQARMGHGELVGVKAVLGVYMQAVDAVLALERAADGIPVLDFLAASDDFQAKLDRVQDLLCSEVDA